MSDTLYKKIAISDRLPKAFNYVPVILDNREIYYAHVTDEGYWYAKVNNSLKDIDDPIYWLESSEDIELNEEFFDKCFNAAENVTKKNSIIIYNNTVYELSEEEFERLMEINEEAKNLPFAGDLHIEEHLNSNINQYKSIGEIDIDFDAPY